MTTVELRPMTPDEYQVWHEQSLLGYAESMAASGYCSQAEAEPRARQQYEQLLPEGLDTPDHGLLVAEHEGERVGIVWVAARPSGAFIYDIEVDPAHRGQGYGRATLAAAEGWARERGLGSIGLHVFAENTAAWQLYTSSGYDVRSANLSKDL